MKIRVILFLLAVPLLDQGASTEPLPPGAPIQVPQVSMPSPNGRYTGLPGTTTPTPPQVVALPSIPSEVANVLHNATKGTLYSLEPTQKPTAGEKAFHNYKVLGQMNLDPKQAATAVKAFEDAIAHGMKNGMSLCLISPRHALSVVADGHTYDFLLCFQCGQLEVLKDDKEIAFVNAGGTSEVLNNLLTAGKVPLSQTGLAVEAQNARYQKLADEARARWVKAMPRSLVPFLGSDVLMQTPEVPDLAPLHAPLAAEFPDKLARIRALLAWYGAGAKDWQNVPTYELAAMMLLQEYSTAEVVAAIQAGPLTDDQMNGAARIFTSYEPHVSLIKKATSSTPAVPSTPQPKYDFAAIPDPLKAALLEYVLKSNNNYNVLFARWAFSPTPTENPLK